jgi:hypothetical protein
VRDVNENLGNQLTSASQMSQQLKKQLLEGDNVCRRLSKIVLAARPAPAQEQEAQSAAPAVSSAKAVAAAAQAFSDRRRSDGLAA